eukprot:tig00000169_g11905.t1
MALQHPTVLGPGGLAMPYAQYSPISPMPSGSGSNIQPQHPPQGVQLSAWASQQRDRYFALEGEARSLTGIESKLAEQDSIVQQFTRVKQRADAHVRDMQGVMDQARKKLSQQEDKFFMKVFQKNKHEQKLDQKARAIESAERQLVEAQAEATEAGRTLAPAAAELERLRAMAARRGQIVAEQEQVLHVSSAPAPAPPARLGAPQRAEARWQNLFAGFAAGDERENAVEGQVGQLAGLHNQIAAALRDQEIGLQHVAHAAELMTDMLKTLRSAAFSNTMDMFSDGLLGMVAGMQTNAALGKVRQQGRQAQACLAQARRYSPFMPMVRDTSNMGWGNLNNFVNVVFDNIFGDIMQAAIINEQTGHIKRALQDVSYNLAWQQQFVGNIRRDLAANSQQLEAARKQLVQERIRLISMMTSPAGPGPAASMRGAPMHAQGPSAPLYPSAPSPYASAGVSRASFPRAPSAKQPPPQHDYNPFR